MANKKVVVAFSGGLDTSYTVMKLTQDGWDVYAACANTGGFSEEQLKKNEENAYKLGAVQYVTLDVTHEYYEKSLKYMIFGNVLRNNCYPISVSSERIFWNLGWQVLCRIVEHSRADAVLAACAMQHVDVDTTLATFPESLVVGKIGKGYWLIT